MLNRRQFIHQTAAFGLTAGLLPGFAGYCAHAADTGLRQRPNVIVIMADDLGYECLGCNGGESYKTPHLDKLAADGVRFTHCFVNPICTPTRTALMTGRYNFRNYTAFNEWPSGEPSFGHMMQDAGYKTAVVGKWQLGAATQDQLGFDEHLLKIDADSEGYADPVIYSSDNPEPEKLTGRYGPDVFYEYISDFLERNRNEEFFLYYPMFLTHFPFTPTPDSHVWESGDRREDDWRKYFPDMVAYMDKIVGQIVSKLEELGIRDNTLIMFLGDNGTSSRITSQFRGEPFRGGKSWLTDAGTHVPLIVNWKGMVEGGRVLDDLVDATDLFQTIADATGAKPRTPPGDGVIDGVSFLPRLMGAEKPARDWVLVEYLNEHRRFGTEQLAFPGNEGRAVRDHFWKLYDTGKSRRGIPFYKGGQLYDMLEDPREERPIEPGANAEADAARKKLQAVFGAHAWQ